MFTLVAGNIVSCLLISLLLTSLLMLLVTVMPKLIAYNFEYNIIHIVVLLVAGVILYIQIMMMVGAVYARGYVSDAENKLLSAKELLEELPDDLVEYTNTYLVDTTQAQDQISKITTPIREYLNSYICKRLIWAAIVYSLLIIFFVFQAKVATKKGFKNYDISGRAKRRDYNF